MIGVTVPVVRRRPGESGVDNLMSGAIPYFAWANRGAGGMRVWIPVQK